jgi:hypothetical protein
LVNEVGCSLVLAPQDKGEDRYQVLQKANEFINPLL